MDDTGLSGISDVFGFMTKQLVLLVPESQASPRWNDYLEVID